MARYGEAYIYGAQSTPFVAVFNATNHAKLDDPSVLPPSICTTVAVMPDGTMLHGYASGGGFRRYTNVYGKHTYLNSLVSPPTFNEITSIAVKPDGSEIIICDPGNTTASNRISVWDTATWTRKSNAQLNAITNQPRFAAYSPDGTKLLLTCDSGTTMMVLNTTTWTVAVTPNVLPPTGTGAAVRWTPDGANFMAFSAGAQLYFYQTSTGFRQSAAQQFTPTSSAFALPDVIDVSPDGTKIAVAIADAPYVQIFNRTGNTLGKSGAPSSTAQNGARALAFNLDGTKLRLLCNFTTERLVQFSVASNGLLTKDTAPPQPPTSMNAPFAIRPVRLDIGDAITSFTIISGTTYLNVYKGAGAMWARLGDPAVLPAAVSRATAVNITQGHVAYAELNALAGNLKIYDATADTLAFVKSIDTVSSPQNCEYSLDGKYLLVWGTPHAQSGGRGFQVFDVQNNYAAVGYASGQTAFTATTNCGFWSHYNDTSRFWVHGATGVGSNTAWMPHKIVGGQLVRETDLATGTLVFNECHRTMLPFGNPSGAAAYVWAAVLNSDALYRYTLAADGATLSLGGNLNSGIGLTDGMSATRGDQATWDRIAVATASTPFWRQYQASTGALPNGGPGSPLPNGRAYLVMPDPDGLGLVVGPGANSSSSPLLRFDFGFGNRGSTYPVPAGIMPFRGDSKNLALAAFPPVFDVNTRPQICTVQ